jgi:lipopolysaccharide export system permease protein
VLVVLAFMGQARTTRTSRTLAVLCAFVVAVFFRVIGIMLSNSAVVRPEAVPLLYAAPACAALSGVIMTQWQLYPRRGSRLARTFIAVWEGLARAVLVLWPRRTAAPVPFGAGG